MTRALVQRRAPTEGSLEAEHGDTTIAFDTRERVLTDSPGGGARSGRAPAEGLVFLWAAEYSGLCVCHTSQTDTVSVQLRGYLLSECCFTHLQTEFGERKLKPQD